jgi:hypothetical protein
MSLDKAMYAGELDLFTAGEQDQAEGNLALIPG